MIEQVVEFSAEFELLPFRQRDILQQGCALSVGSRLAERVAGENTVKGSVHRDLTGERSSVCHALPARIIDLVDREVEKAVGRHLIRNQRAWARRCPGEAGPRPCPIEAKIRHSGVGDGKWL